MNHSPRTIPVILYGAGGVGQALLRQIIDGRAVVAARAGCRFEVVAIVDSRSWLGAPTGLSDETLQAALAAKKRRRPVDPAAQALLPSADDLAAADEGERHALRVRAHQQLEQWERPSDLAILDQLAAAGVRDGVVVDVTAATGMEPVIDRALELGFGVALANKKPLTGPWAAAQRFFHHPRLRHESTVGGGQPVIATLRYLLDTADPIHRIEGQLSGTLGFICRQMDDGQPFSQALAMAKAKGFTEPDPREDLGGRDVMRKVLILARLSGWPMEAADIDVEALYPPSLAQLPVNEFMAAAIALDPAMGDRVNAAGAAGEVLRYVAEVSDRRGRVALSAVAAGSPLANMKYISFQTDRYHDEPLLIGGKGAGVEMTAAGVIGDMIALVRERPTG